MEAPQRTTIAIKVIYTYSTVPQYKRTEAQGNYGYMCVYCNYMYIKLNRVASGRALPLPVPRPVCSYEYDNKNMYSLRHAVTIDVTSLTTRS